MVAAVIFLVHLIFVIYIFYRRYKSDSFSSALIDSILILILFSVGWSISTQLTKIFWDPIGFGKHFDRDTIALSLTSVAEYFFYRIYFKDLFITSNGKER